MAVRTIQSSEIDNAAIADRLASLQSPADDAGLVAAGVALCYAVEQAGGDRMEIEIGCVGSGADLSGGWRVSVMRADDAVAADGVCQKYREMLLGLCDVDNVRAEVPPMLDCLRGHLDNSIELSDDDVRHIDVLIDVLKFLLETEPEQPDSSPCTVDEAVGERVLDDFMKSAHD